MVTNGPGENQMSGHSQDFPLPIADVADHIVHGEREVPLPRGAGADAPQSETKPGDIPLMYTEQNFNQLVAANTALMSEIAGRDELLKEKDELIFTLRERIDDFQANTRRLEKELSDSKKSDAANMEVLAEKAKRIEYLGDLLVAQKLRTERAKGYIDRFLDEEQRLDPAVPAPVQPVQPAAKGPDLGSIQDPHPPFARNQAGDREAMFSMRAATMSRDSIYHAPRRY